jgi:hypothetical protein
MSIGEYDAVRGRNPGEIIAARTSLLAPWQTAGFSRRVTADSAHYCIEVCNTFLKCQPLTFLMAIRNKQLDCSS